MGRCRLVGSLVVQRYRELSAGLALGVACGDFDFDVLRYGVSAGEGEDAAVPFAADHFAGDLVERSGLGLPGALVRGCYLHVVAQVVPLKCAVMSMSMLSSSEMVMSSKFCTSSGAGSGAGGSGVAVGGTGVAVGGTGVAVGGTGVGSGAGSGADSSTSETVKEPLADSPLASPATISIVRSCGLAGPPVSCSSVSCQWPDTLLRATSLMKPVFSLPVR